MINGSNNMTFSLVILALLIICCSALKI